ncbi:prolipoprotein diacylglyceryl transferase, partial [Candidatus Woesearchaeota archaeon]|nr:prolipoprotein diacylglyceryl transferase [Candidatus Woesearchaeota archaeon]
LSLRKEFKLGFIFLNFVFWEGLGRFILDFWKEDPLLSGLTLGQWMSVVMVIIAGYALITHYPKEWGKIFK